MLVGYNHNIRHKGKLYHIQTEDSGCPGMYITTLLYSGGTIIASKKTEYSELDKADTGFEDSVRQLMQNQHKELLINLKDGAYEDIVKSGPEEAEETAKEGEMSILDAIGALESKTLDKIISEGESSKEKKNLHEDGKKEKRFDKVVMDLLSGELYRKKDGVNEEE